VSTVEPIWTIALASLLFAESLGPLQLVGGAMILLGVVIAQTTSGSGAPSSGLRIADE
jgi:drug/metabolite transporter (DMT)-like permease